MTNNNKTLKNFLKKHNACEDGYIFAKDLTLEQFLNTCPRGDWILWLFAKINPESLKELTLAKGHCANTVRHLMKDDRIVKAVDAAIKFGEGKISKKELDNVVASTPPVVYAAFAANYFSDAYAAYAPYDSASYAHAKIQYQKKTANICRKYLPIEIWNNI